MQIVKSDKLYYEISRHNQPAITIKPGETIKIETEDAFSGQIRTNSDRRDRNTVPNSNPQSGPIFVEGADNGDTLVIDIVSITPRIAQAATHTTSSPGLVSEFLGTNPPHGTRICKIKDNKIWWNENLSIPYKPMIGTIGTAPSIGVPTTVPAGPHGGNMDIKEVTEGNTVYLPVFVKGALLHLGDAHAAQGDGELCCTGFEMAASIIITVSLIKNTTIHRPRIRSPKEIMTVATGTPMERSIAQAYSDLILWMEEEYKIDRWDGWNLCTHVGAISVGYYAIGTVATKIETKYLSVAQNH